MKNRHDFADDWPSPNPFMLELGRMTCVWGALESAVNIAISKLAGYKGALDYRAVILVAHSNFQQRIDIINSLCEQLLPSNPALAGYKKVIASIETAQKARNKYAHNGLVMNPEKGEVTIGFASARGSLKTKVEVVRVQDILEATAKIHEAMCNLHTLVMGKELKPMWERGT
ncbi:hypothetical protein [Nitrosomonas sp.]|uniref:hypothetical protein n=1 Tax=Nitrosomonas sp. TaxID=42353 RepID=UPI00374DE262